MKNSQIITQEPLVTDSYRVSKKLKMTHKSAFRNIKATIDVYEELEYKYQDFGSEILDIHSHIVPAKLKTDRGRIIDGYQLTEMGYMLTIQQFSTPKLRVSAILLAYERLVIAHKFIDMNGAINGQ